jgi:LmbE family N-acetylglucosaminyl deacetylase
MTAARFTTSVVVAHPDDETLWMSSVVGSADRIVFGFGDIFDKPRESEARRQAVATLPLSGIVSLGIPESGAGWKSSQVQLELTAPNVSIFDAAARARYESNYPRLQEGLRSALSGCCDVYTHNPWGEYGHSEHIQIYRAVTALQDELGYTVWYSNYVGGRNWTFARRLAESLSWARRSLVTPDLDTVRKLMRVYRRCGAWTYPTAHRWPAREVMYAQPPSNSPEVRRPLSGEWLLDLDKLRWWSPRWRSAWRCLSDDRVTRVHTTAGF